MNKNIAELVKNIKEVAELSRAKYKFEDNTSINYIVIENLEDETDAYFFQDEEADNLREEYKSSCVYEYVTFEEYIRNSHVSW